MTDPTIEPVDEAGAVQPMDSEPHPQPSAKMLRECAAILETAPYQRGYEAGWLRAVADGSSRPVVSEPACEEPTGGKVVRRVSRRRHRCSPPGWRQRRKLDLDFGSRWACACGVVWEWSAPWADPQWVLVGPVEPQEQP